MSKSTIGSQRETNYARLTKKERLAAMKLSKKAAKKAPVKKEDKE